MAIDNVALKKQFDAMRPATVAQQAQALKGKGPGGSDLVAWRDPKTGKTISGNQLGNSAYAEPVWGPAPQAHHEESGHGGGGEGGGNGGEDLPTWKPIYNAILRDLESPKFNANKFRQNLGIITDEGAIKAARARHVAAGQYRGSGQMNEQVKDINEAQYKEYLANLDQLANDERTFLQSQRDRGVAGAANLFTTQLNARTRETVAAKQAAYAAAIAESQMAFASQQNELNRALEREKLNALSSFSKSGSGLNTLTSILGGIGSGISIGSSLR